MLVRAEIAEKVRKSGQNRGGGGAFCRSSSLNGNQKEVKESASGGGEHLFRGFLNGEGGDDITPVRGHTLK